SHQRQFDIENTVVLLFESEPLDLPVLLRRFQLEHQVHATFLERREEAKERSNIGDAEPADLDVVAKEARAHTDEIGDAFATDHDDVVCDESMTATNEIQRCLALADAARPENESTEMKDFEERAVELRLRSEASLEPERDAADQDRATKPCRKERHPGAIRLFAQIVRRFRAVGDD